MRLNVQYDSHRLWNTVEYKIQYILFFRKDDLIDY